MANNYADKPAKAILLNDGEKQLLPVSKAKLIELANDQKAKFNNAADVQGALTYLLEHDDTYLAAANKHTDDSIAALDSSVDARTGYVLSGITEVDGKLTAYTETWLDASIVSYNGEGNVDDVESALTDIYGKLAKISGSGSGSIQDQINAAINALDVTAIGEAGKAIVSVSETDGKIAATAGNVDAQYVDVNNNGDKFKIGSDKTTLTAQETLEHLQGEINAAVGDAARYTVSKITTDLPANVGVRYQLMQSIGGAQATAVEAPIDIPADSTLKEVYLGSDNDTVDKTNGTVTKNTVDDPQSMNFVHKLADGTYSITKIDVSKFFTQSERGDGLVKTGATLAVGLDTASEKFLTVEKDGIKLSGVQTAIDNAEKAAQTYTGTSIEALDSKIASKTDNGFSYVMTGVTETDGKLTDASYIGLSDVTVKTTAFDSNSELYKLLDGNVTYVTDIHSALNKIAGKVSEGATNAVTNVVGDSDNTYVNVTASKSGNTVTLTVNDSALGNVAKLHYDVLAPDVESVTILGANPTV